MEDASRKALELPDELTIDYSRHIQQHIHNTSDTSSESRGDIEMF